MALHCVICVGRQQRCVESQSSDRDEESAPRLQDGKDADLLHRQQPVHDRCQHEVGRLRDGGSENQRRGGLQEPVCH